MLYLTYIASRDRADPSEHTLVPFGTTPGTRNVPFPRLLTGKSNDRGKICQAREFLIYKIRKFTKIYCEFYYFFENQNCILTPTTAIGFPKSKLIPNANLIIGCLAKLWLKFKFIVIVIPYLTLACYNKPLTH